MNASLQVYDIQQPKPEQWLITVQVTKQTTSCDWRVSSMTSVRCYQLRIGKTASGYAWTLAIEDTTPPSPFLKMVMEQFQQTTRFNVIRSGSSDFWNDKAINPMRFVGDAISAGLAALGQAVA